jgi:hypothetical protein
MKTDNNKTLMFAISNSLSKSEAISFARTMNGGDKWYITCVYKNPKARHIEDRERWVVIRDVRKGEQGVLDALKSIEAALPFPLKGFDCDNGSEFMNWTILKHFQDRKRPVHYTRSREY